MNAMMKFPEKQKMTASTIPGEKTLPRLCRCVNASSAAANGTCEGRAVPRQLVRNHPADDTRVDHGHWLFPPSTPESRCLP
jgi:hypothetical protein